MQIGTLSFEGILVFRVNPILDERGHPGKQTGCEESCCTKMAEILHLDGSK